MKILDALAADRAVFVLLSWAGCKNAAVGTAAADLTPAATYTVA